MRYLLLAVPLVASICRGGDPESQLAAARNIILKHAVAERKLSGIHQRAGLASSAFAETAAALEQISRSGNAGELPHSRERLHAAVGAIEADLASIDARLATLDLPEKLSAWREFVASYRSRLAQVDAAFSPLAAGHGTLPREEIRRRADELRSMISAAESQLTGEFRRRGTRQRLSTSAPLGVPQRFLAVPQATEPPSAGDLAESKIVALTPEIRAKAAALGKDPSAIYRLVATQVEYMPAIGQMQNSSAVLTSRRGNDFDQATLLIALLRASGIPARYVAGDVVMPRADVREWLGVKDETLALQLLGSAADFLLFPSVDKEKVTATRVWVEAYVDTADGKCWLAMDPARKRREFRPGIVLSRPVYDRMAYLRALKPVPPGEAYLDSLRADFHKKYPGRAFSEVAFESTLLPPPAPSPEYPYPVSKLHFRAAEVPSGFWHRIRLALTDVTGRTAFHSLDLVLPEVVLQSITLSFEPATSADQRVVDAFGGIGFAPAAVVNLVPQFRLGDQVLATGKTPVPSASVLDLTVNHTPPVQGAASVVYSNHHYFTAGETAALVLGAHLVSEELVMARVSRFLGRLPAATNAQATRMLLDVAALRYLQRVELDEERLSGPLQVRFYPDGEIGNAITFASLEPKNLFDRPFVLTPGRLQIHAWPTCLPFIDLNRPDHNDPIVKTSWQLHNDAISALEHEVWEELVLIPSVSTIKILQAAIKENNPIHSINRGNAAAEIRALEVPQSTKDTLQARINAGATLLVPRRPVAIGSWRGTGWIEEFENWDYNYIIFSLALPSPGGDTGGTPAPPRPPQNDPGTIGSPSHQSNTTCSDPVNLANGNLIEQLTDIVLAMRGPGIIFRRTYNSLALADGPVGIGWRHSYQISLKESGGTITIRDGSGAVLTFRQTGGAWTAPSGSYLTLTKDAQGYLLRTRHGMESRFDSSGSLQSINDRNRNSLQFTYEGDRLRRIADRSSQGVTLDYDAKNRVTSVEDFTGRRVLYEYDPAGRLTAVVNPSGGRTLYVYYTDRVFNHLLKSITTPGGSVTGFEYYGNGKVARVTLPGGQHTSFLYLPMRGETHVMNAKGALTSYFYNAQGSVVRIVRPDGAYLDRTYDSGARLESHTDSAGYATRYTYDAAGNLTSVADSLGRSISFTYDTRFNLLASLRDAAGNVSAFEYDERGNLVRSIRPPDGETRYAWDNQGNLLSQTDAEGNTFTFTYDEAGNPIMAADALGNISRGEYDGMKQLVKAIDPTGIETARAFDLAGRLVKQVDGVGRGLSVSYDAEGRISAMTDPAGRSAAFRYDPLGQLTQAVDAMKQTADYGYSTPDCGCSATPNLVSFRDPAGYVLSLGYDSQDRLVQATDAMGHASRFAYDSQGLLSSKTAANGASLRLERDAIGRVTRKLYSDGTEARFTYDASSNLTVASNQHVTYTYTYDARRRITSVTDSRFNKTMAYTYDRLGRRTSLTDFEGGVHEYAWDSSSRIESIRAPSGAAAQFGYDAAGRLKSVKYSNDTTSSIQYDAAGRLTSLLHATGSQQTLAAFAYDYDATGNVMSITDSSGVHSYQYDALDHMTAASHPSLPAETYSYDPAGNRTASAVSAYSYDATGRLSSAEGSTFQYDSNGNVIRKTAANGTATYTWDAAGQLIRIGLPQGGSVSYKYDPLGRRIEKDVNGTVTAYAYDASSILLELDSSGLIKARYTHAPGVDRPLSVEQGGQTYFFHQDAASNVVLLTGSSGSAVCSYTYDSFGQTQPCPEIANPYGFAGREYDPESGLYSMRARYYDPAIGRFLSRDPLDLSHLILEAQDSRAAAELLPPASAALVRRRSKASLRSPQRLNSYSYALSNPLSFRDPSGLSCMVHVQIGWSPAGEGATMESENAFSGNISNFNHWLQQNHYSLHYTEGPFAGILDQDTGQIVGVVNAQAAGFNHIPPTESPSVFSGQFWQGVGSGFAEVGQSLVQNFQASFQVPWHQLSGQQYWDAMNNPQNYVKR